MSRSIGVIWIRRLWIASIAAPPGFEHQHLFSDAFGVVCRFDHSTTQNWDTLNWADLEGVDFIANGLCYQITDEGFQPILAGARLIVRNTASLLGLVQAGVGLTLLPRLVALPGFGDLSFLPLRSAFGAPVGVDDPAAPSFGPVRS